MPRQLANGTIDLSDTDDDQRELIAPRSTTTVNGPQVIDLTLDSDEDEPLPPPPATQRTVQTPVTRPDTRPISSNRRSPPLFESTPTKKPTRLVRSPSRESSPDILDEIYKERRRRSLNSPEKQAFTVKDTTPRRKSINDSSTLHRRKKTNEHEEPLKQPAHVKKGLKAMNLLAGTQTGKNSTIKGEVPRLGPPSSAKGIKKVTQQMKEVPKKKPSIVNRIVNTSIEALAERIPTTTTPSVRVRDTPAIQPEAPSTRANEQRQPSPILVEPESVSVEPHHDPSPVAEDVDISHLFDIPENPPDEPLDIVENVPMDTRIDVPQDEPTVPAESSPSIDPPTPLDQAPIEANNAQPTTTEEDTTTSAMVIEDHTEYDPIKASENAGSTWMADDINGWINEKAKRARKKVSLVGRDGGGDAFSEDFHSGWRSRPRPIRTHQNATSIFPAISNLIIRQDEPLKMDKGKGKKKRKRGVDDDDDEEDWYESKKPRAELEEDDSGLLAGLDLLERLVTKKPAVADISVSAATANGAEHSGVDTDSPLTANQPSFGGTDEEMAEVDELPDESVDIEMDRNDMSNIAPISLEQKEANVEVEDMTRTESQETVVPAPRSPEKGVSNESQGGQIPSDVQFSPQKPGFFDEEDDIEPYDALHVLSANDMLVDSGPWKTNSFHNRERESTTSPLKKVQSRASIPSTSTPVNLSQQKNDTPIQDPVQSTTLDFNIFRDKEEEDRKALLAEFQDVLEHCPDFRGGFQRPGLSPIHAPWKILAPYLRRKLELDREDLVKKGVLPANKLQ